jgi:hypothetical protein
MNIDTNTNSASRIYDILKKASQEGDNQQTFQAWSNVLGIQLSDVVSDSFKVSEAIALIRNELDLVEAEMDSTRFSDFLFKPYLNSCRQALQVTNLSVGWSSFRSHLSAETLLCLQYCSEIIPRNDQLVEAAELEELLQSVHELSCKLQESNLSPTIKELIKKHLSLIYAAIHKYPISGTRALRDGLRAGMNEIVEDQEIIRANSNEDEVSSLINLWGRFKKAGNGVIEADKIANAAINLISKANDGITFFQNLLPPS